MSPKKEEEVTPETTYVVAEWVYRDLAKLVGQDPNSERMEAHGNLYIKSKDLGRFSMRKKVKD